jgi:hypothetical protein
MLLATPSKYVAEAVGWAPPTAAPPTALCRLLDWWAQPTLLTHRSPGRGGTMRSTHARRRLFGGRHGLSIPCPGPSDLRTNMSVRSRDPDLTVWAISFRPSGPEAGARNRDCQIGVTAGWPSSGLDILIDAEAPGGRSQPRMTSSFGRCEALPQPAKRHCWTSQQWHPEFRQQRLPAAMVLFANCSHRTENTVH